MSLLPAPRSRGRFAGQKVSKEEIEKKVLELARKGYGASEISSTSGKSRRQVTRILSTLKEKGLLTTTSTGRIEKTPAMEEAQGWRELSTDEFVNSYDCVKSWVEDMRSRKQGKGLKKIGEKVATLKGDCDLLKVKPCVFHVDKETTETFVKSLNQLAKARNPNLRSIKHLIMPVRSFCQFHGINWTRGVDGIMSAKKQNFGAYSRIQMTDPQIIGATKYAVEKYGLAKGLYVGLGLETVCARMETELNLRSEDIQFKTFEGYSYVTFEVFEQKTETKYPKLAIHPYILNLLRLRLKEHPSGFLFGNGSAPTTSKETDELSAILKDSYRHVGLDVDRDDTGQTLINYWKRKPFHSQRHVGAQLWLRRTNYDYEAIAGMGWGDISTLRMVYGARPFEFIFQKGVCYTCNPPKVREETATFCSFRCALIGVNEEYTPQGERKA